MTIPLDQLVTRSTSREGHGVAVRRDRQTNVTGVSRHLCIYSRPIRALRLLSIGLVIIASASVYAQRPELLDPRVTQTTITNTICEPAYLEKVIPPLNSRLQWKDYLLRERGVDPKTAWQYTFDFRVSRPTWWEADRAREFRHRTMGGALRRASETTSDRTSEALRMLGRDSAHASAAGNFGRLGQGASEALGASLP